MKWNKLFAKLKKPLIIAGCTLAVAFVAGFFLNCLFTYNFKFRVDINLLVDGKTYLYAFLLSVIALTVVLAYYYKHYWLKNSKKIIQGDERDNDVAANLEQAHFQTDEEVEKNYAKVSYAELPKTNLVGIPIRAVERKGRYEIHFAKNAHTMIIGTTGSGKTTTFINPTVQILSQSAAKPSIEVYERKGITPMTDLTMLAPSDYPIFDDLAALIDEKLAKTGDDYNRACLKVIENYIAKFKSGGRNSNLWNGASNFETDENFVCFDFQKLLANKNGLIANAQMLLVLKYLENEVIKNRDYNLKNGTDRKIIVVVDEAHLFIDEKYPIALDFMYQLAKRIRKYNGMEIVITQSIKDFAGTPETARKSMAIINVSQYSLIFPLSPNDMNDLCALYEKAGQINEIEADNIVHNERGCAFLISSPESRTNIRIVATPYFEKIFG